MNPPDRGGHVAQRTTRCTKCMSSGPGMSMPIARRQLLDALIVGERRDLRTQRRVAALRAAVACWIWRPTPEPSFSTSTRIPTITTSSTPSTGIQARPRTMRSSRGSCSRSARRGGSLARHARGRSSARAGAVSRRVRRVQARTRVRRPARSRLRARRAAAVARPRTRGARGARRVSLDARDGGPRAGRLALRRDAAPWAHWRGAG